MVLSMVVLGGITRSARGFGLYGEMLHHCLHHLDTVGTKEIVLSTQVGHTTVQRVWAREGFLPRAAYLTVHLNREPAGGGPFKVRVALGLGAKYDKVLIEDPRSLGSIRSLAAGPAAGNQQVSSILKHQRRQMRIVTCSKIQNTLIRRFFSRRCSA